MKKSLDNWTNELTHCEYEETKSIVRAIINETEKGCFRWRKFRSLRLTPIRSVLLLREDGYMKLGSTLDAAHQGKKKWKFYMLINPPKDTD